MKRVLVLAAMLAVTLTVAAPTLARDVPDFSSAERLPPPNTDYEITDDGYLIYEDDIVQSCEELPYRKGASHAALVEACTESGFPPKGTLPQTGGVRFVLVPVGLLVAGGLVIRAVAPR